MTRSSTGTSGADATIRPALVVLAAGMGSRYGGLKQIEPVGPSGETLLDYSIFDAVRAGFGKVVFVIRRDIEEAFVETVGAKYQGLDDVEIRYAFQELEGLPEGYALPEGRAKPWGTGHATLVAEEELDEPFAVVNADDFYGARAFALLGGHLRAPGDEYAMVGFRLRDTLSDHGAVVRGVCETEGDHLRKIVELRQITRDGDGGAYLDASGEQGRLDGDTIVSMNFWGFRRGIFPHLRDGLVAFLEEHIDHPSAEFLLPDVVDELIAAGKTSVRVLPGGGPWFGVTHREDREGVERSIRELVDAGEYPRRLWE